MEQQERALQKQAEPKETGHSEPQQQEQRSGISFAVQALRDGGTVWDLPRESLEELAGRVGNSAMQALTAMRAPKVALHQTALADTEPQTAATEVPDAACPLIPSADLTAGSWPASTFDPAGLA